jgi:hypothetical protein
MAKIATAIGILLIVVSLVFRLALGVTHFTVFIPAALGVLILICGLVARDESKRKHAMHGAAGLALLGVLGSAPIAAGLPAALNGTSKRPLASIESALLLVICLVFLALCVNSFIAARRSRE